MNRNTKHIIMAVLVVMIIITIVMWYKSRPYSVTVKSLRSVLFVPRQVGAICDPVCDPGKVCVEPGVCIKNRPVLTFKFDEDISKYVVGNTTASVSFVPNESSNDAENIISAIGSFVPVLYDKNTIITNEAPKGTNEATESFLLEGTGSMVFMTEP